MHHQVCCKNNCFIIPLVHCLYYVLTLQLAPMRKWLSDLSMGCSFPFAALILRHTQVVFHQQNSLHVMRLCRSPRIQRPSSYFFSLFIPNAILVLLWLRSRFSIPLPRLLKSTRSTRRWTFAIFAWSVLGHVRLCLTTANNRKNQELLAQACGCSYNIRGKT